MATTYDFTTRKGDTRNAITFSGITLNTVPVVITAARMQVKKKATDTEIIFSPVLSFVGDSVSITKQIWDIPAKAYVYDIELTLDNGDVKTWIGGAVTVEQDVTE